jgi:hypothetical protein
MRASGAAIGQNDMWIAAATIAAGLTADVAANLAPQAAPRRPLADVIEQT